MKLAKGTKIFQKLLFNKMRSVGKEMKKKIK